MYSAEIIAKYIIMRCNKLNKTISNLKLQKILYFVQAEFLVARNVPCFSNTIEAWDFGPVVPDVYHRYKVYGSANIPFNNQDEEFPFSDEEKALIDGIVDECAKYPASVLVEITHRQAPWRDAYLPYCNAIISTSSIKPSFEEK